MNLHLLAYVIINRNQNQKKRSRRLNCFLKLRISSAIELSKSSWGVDIIVGLQYNTVVYNDQEE